MVCKLNKEQKHILVWGCLIYGVIIYLLVYFGLWFLALWVGIWGFFDLRKMIRNKEARKKVLEGISDLKRITKEWLSEKRK